MKFFGIIDLLIWHTGIHKINIFVIQFFLQMFIFTSGYFYKDEYSNKPFTFIKKRISSLYLPYIFYCSAFLAFNNAFVALAIYKKDMLVDADNIIRYFLRIFLFDNNQQLTGAMWFVPTLFIVSILFLFICKVSEMMAQTSGYFKEREHTRFFLIASLYLLGNYLAFHKYQLPVLLDISFVLLIFYYGGYLFRKHEQKIPLNIFLALPILLALLLGMNYGFPHIIQREYVNPSSLLLYGMAGIYLNLFIAHKCPTSFKVMRLINFAGRNTMEILAFHFLSFKTVTLFIIYSQNLPLNLLSSFPVIQESSQYYRWLYVLSGLVVPLCGVYCFNTVREKLKPLILGRTEQIN